MGNQLSGLSPISVVNVEDYLSDLSGFVRFEEELCGSRLFKVAKIKRTNDRNCYTLLVKIFSNPNASQMLWQYQALMHPYCHHIPMGHNLLFFSMSYVTERCGVLIRDFIDQSLADRLCTRPFLCIEDKKWIAYQLLCALDQLHNAKTHNKVKLASSSKLTKEDDEEEGMRDANADQTDIHSTTTTLSSLSTALGDPSAAKPHVSSNDEMTNQPTMSETHQDEMNQSTSTVRTVADVLTSGEVDDTDSDQKSDINSANILKMNGQLNPSMDLFSVGCVLLELFTDGSIAFTLADLLSYRRNDYSRLNKLLEQVTCDHTKSLILTLLSLDPEKRGSAAQHLKEQCGKAFPQIFYTDLTSYLKHFLHPSLGSPDSRIAFLKWTLGDFLKEIVSSGRENLNIVSVIICNLIISVLRPTSSQSCNNQTPSTAADLPVFEMTDKRNSFCFAPSSLNTSNSHQQQQQDFGLKSTADYETASSRLSEQGKVNALVCLFELTDYMNPGLLLDRVMPYCVDLTAPHSNHSAEVRSLAIDGLTYIFKQITMKCTDATTNAAYLDDSFLIEYLFPSLVPLGMDPNVEVRLVIARCLPVLAQSSIRFLHTVTKMRLQSVTSEMDEKTQVTSISSNQNTTSSSMPTATTTQPSSFINSKLSVNSLADSHLSVLKSHIQDRLVTFFSDVSPHVRLCLMNTSGLVKLAVFFGRSRTNGTLLSHMITFLNDKTEPALRAAFFRQVSLLASLIGAQSISVLRSLLEQGLIDPDELVVETCLQSLTHLLRRRLLSAPIAVGFLSQALALTAYPSQRIRQASVAYITGISRLAMDFQEKSEKLAAANDNDDRPDGGGGGNKFDDSSPNQFWPGICSPASVYARLVNNEIKKTVFFHPVHYCFTSDIVLLVSLQPPIHRLILETLVFMPNVFTINPNILSGADMLYVNQPAAAAAAAAPLANAASAGLANAYPVQETSSQLKIDRLTQLFKVFDERKSARGVTRLGETPCYVSANDESIDALINKLKLMGLTDLMESQLVNLSNLILNMSRNTCRMPGRSQPDQTSAKANRGLLKYSMCLLDPKQLVASQTNTCPKSPSELLSKPVYLQWLIQTPLQRYMNTILERLNFGQLPLNWQSLDGSKLLISNRTLVLLNSVLSQGSSQSTFAASNAMTAVSANDKAAQLARSGSNTSVNGAVYKKAASQGSNDHYFDFMLKSAHKLQANRPVWPGSCPQGILVACLHEHKPGFLHLATHNSGRLLASSSSGDGTVKLWNCGFWPTESDCYLDRSSLDSANHCLSSNRINTNPINLLDSNSKSTSLKQSELCQTYCLPTHSSWTYNTTESDSIDNSSTSCRGLIWTDNGCSLVTVANAKCLHQIDASTGQCIAMRMLDSASLGQATCLTGSTSAMFPAKFNLIQSVSGGASDTNLCVLGTTSNQIVAQDLRLPNLVWSLKQDRMHGLIRSIAMHSSHTWLVTGTSRGHLVCWDLRYQRPVAYTEHPYQPPVAILNLQIVETPSSLGPTKSIGQANFDHVGRHLIVAATDHHNEVTLWDLEVSASASSAACSPSLIKSPTSIVQGTGCIASTWAQPGNGSRLVLDNSLPHCSVRALLCLNDQCTSSNSADYKLNCQLPSMITGGNDARLRYWNFRKPQNSRTLAWAGNEEALPPKANYQLMDINGVYVLAENLTSHSSQHPTNISTSLLKNVSHSSELPTKEACLTSSFPSNCRLELRESTRGHKNIISDLTILHAGQAYLVSSSMDGIIKIWR